MGLGHGRRAAVRLRRERLLLLPSWYGAGAALSDGDLVMQREMWHGWPFFRGLIGTLEMALFKTDLGVAERYLRLVDDDLAERFWTDRSGEYDRVVERVLAITGQRGLLDETPALQRRLEHRNPWVDPLSHLQVELLERLRAGPRRRAHAAARHDHGDRGGHAQHGLMAGRYGALLSTPGARAPLILSTAGSMPIGMYGLAILLLAHDTTGSFASAGRVVGAFSLANAFGAVAQGRLMDRLGQTRVLRVVATGHLPALVLLVVAADAGGSVWMLSLCAACGGVTLPQLPASMRSLWNALVDDPEQRATAYALVAVVFEVAVVTAPVIVAGIVAVASPAVAVIAAAALAAGSAAGFTATHASRRWRGTRHEAGWLGPLAAPGMRTVFAVLLAFGIAVGVVQVAVPAFAEARGLGGDRRRAAGGAVGRQPRRRAAVRLADLARPAAVAPGAADARARRDVRAAGGRRHAGRARGAAGRSAACWWRRRRSSARRCSTPSRRAARPRRRSRRW